MRFFLLLLGLISVTPALHADTVETATATTSGTPIPTYPEIPYYIRQLNEATVEQRRIELTKIIHNAVVNAELSDKHVVKAMEPMVANIRISMDSGLDRAYLEGSSMWLGSAVDYFEREKLRSTVEVPESDWLPSQTVTADGGRLNITPDKVWLINKEKSSLIVESSDIHEAVITPDGKHAAFSRESKDQTHGEIWSVNMKSRVRKKLATVNSCVSLVISGNGNRIFFQEKPSAGDKESAVWTLGFGGGTPKKIGEARLLQTVVEKGPHKNALVVYKNRLHHLGIALQECAYIWEENGREIGRLKNISCR